MSLIPASTTLPPSPLTILLPPGDFRVFAPNPVASLALGYREGLPIIQQPPVTWQASEPGGLVFFGLMVLLMARLLIKGGARG